MSDCLFCKIRDNELPAHKIYEDEDTVAFLDIGPVSKGHALIIPREHAEDLNSGSEAAALAVMKTTYKIAPLMMEALGATGYNLGMNHGLDGGQDVFHTHMHLMPRYKDSERKFIKSFPSQEGLADVAEQIRLKIDEL